jgi:hypothetical protein
MESVGEFIVGHARFAPGGLAELDSPLLWRLVVFFWFVGMFGFEVEVSCGVEDLL